MGVLSGVGGGTTVEKLISQLVLPEGASASMVDGKGEKLEGTAYVTKGAMIVIADKDGNTADVTIIGDLVGDAPVVTPTEPTAEPETETTIAPVTDETVTETPQVSDGGNGAVVVVIVIAAVVIIGAVVAVVIVKGKKSK